MRSGESTTRSFPGLAAEPAPTTGAQPGAAVPAAPMPAALSPGERRLRRVRRAIVVTLAALAALVAARLWMLDGILRTVRIEGPSMAPALDGAHYALACDDCRFAFRCDALDPPASGKVVCPNCGYKHNSLEQATLRRGERVLVDRWPYLWQAPARGHVVAAREPGAPNELVVKRVAALPGERLAIRGGDLFDGDSIIRKTPAQWRALRILVHDNNYRPQESAGLPARWQTLGQDSHWRHDAGLLQYLPTGDDAAQADWLAFQPWRCAEQGSRTEVVPIFDNDSYNPGANRSLNPVPDVGCSFRLTAAEGSRFAVAVVDGRQRFELRFDLAMREVRLVAADETLATATLPARFGRRPVEVAVALCDQQVLLSVGGRALVRHPYQRPAGPRVEVLQPIAIGGIRGKLQLADLCVWRDVYYLNPGGAGRPWQAEEPVAPGDLAVLGDNPPVSIDSRNWQQPLAESAVLGRVYRPFWATRR